jgi:hypothetical protein
VEPYLWPWTGILLVSGEGGATLPNSMIIWSNFFFGNWGTNKVTKYGMAMARLALGRSLGQTLPEQSLQCCWTCWGTWCRSGEKWYCERMLVKIELREMHYPRKTVSTVSLLKILYRIFHWSR